MSVDWLLWPSPGLVRTCASVILQRFDGCQDILAHWQAWGFLAFNVTVNVAFQVING